MKANNTVKSLLAAVLAVVMLVGCSRHEAVSGGDVSSVTSSAASTSSSSSSTTSSSSSSSVRTLSSYKLIVPPNADGTGGSVSLPPAQSSSAAASTSPAAAPVSVTESSSNEPIETPPPVISGGTPVARHGELSVNGAYLVDENGRKVQLRGMSTHGLAWFPDYVNYDTFKYLRDEWNTNCIRLAMYTAEYNGYCTGGDKAWLKSLVNNGVEYATSLGMYVIIDWHVLNERTPMTYKEEAKAFFDEMSRKYANNPNVLYEICNEPNSGVSWSEISTYANEIIPVIRRNSPDSVIIVGTPTWSQEVDKAAAAPLGYDNIMYTLHFYADTHRDSLRNTMESCIRGGLPVFISEFGMCDASGNGAVNESESNKWKALIDKYNISYMCWNLANKGETSSIIQSGCSKLYGWNDGDLGQQGRLIREWFLSEDD